MPVRRKPVTMEDYQKSAKRRDSQFIKRIQVTQHLNKQDANRFLDNYRKQSASYRKETRNRINAEYEAINYGDKKDVEVSAYVPKTKPVSKNIWRQPNWFDVWKKEKGIVERDGGGYNRELSTYEKRIVNGHKKNPYATLMDLRGH